MPPGGSLMKAWTRNKGTSGMFCIMRFSRLLILLRQDFSRLRASDSKFERFGMKQMSTDKVAREVTQFQLIHFSSCLRSSGLVLRRTRRLEPPTFRKCSDSQRVESFHEQETSSTLQIRSDSPISRFHSAAWKFGGAGRVAKG